MRRILSSVRDGRGFDIVLVAFPLGFLFLMAGLPLIYNVVMSFQEVDMETACPAWTYCPFEPLSLTTRPGCAAVIVV